VIHLLRRSRSIAGSFNGEKKMTVRLLDRAGLKAKGICWNGSTLWRKTTSGEFPKAVLVGNRNMWIEAEVDQYIQNLIARRGEVDAHPVGDAVAEVA
jgi:predicted DNA-binding transcriptional regulator AlpA